MQILGPGIYAYGFLSTECTRKGCPRRPRDTQLHVTIVQRMTHLLLHTKPFETTALWDWAPHEAVIPNAKRDKTYAVQDWAPCEAPSPVLGRAQAFF